MILLTLLIMSGYTIYALTSFNYWSWEGKYTRRSHSSYFSLLLIMMSENRTRTSSLHHSLEVRTLEEYTQIPPASWSLRFENPRGSALLYIQSHEPWTWGEKQEYMWNSYSSLPPHHMLWGVTYTLGSFPRHPFPPGEPGARYTPEDKLPLTLSLTPPGYLECSIGLYLSFAVSPTFWEKARERERSTHRRDI